MPTVMRPFPEDSNVEMIWTRTRTFPEAWELRAGDELIGTLRWLRLFRSEAEGETSQGRWRFHCEGFLALRTEAIDDTARVCAAVTQRRFGGDGEVTFPDGRRIVWTCRGWAPRIQLFATTDRFPIMRFPIELHWLGTKRTIEIDQTARSMKELPLLALLGRYLIVQRNRRKRH